MSNHESCIEDGDSFCRHPHDCGTTTPATQAPLPVTLDARTAYCDYEDLDGKYRERVMSGAWDNVAGVQAFSRFERDILARQDHSLPGGVGTRAAQIADLIVSPDTAANDIQRQAYWHVAHEAAKLALGVPEDDPACTDCGDTGVTYQTESPCSCRAALTPSATNCQNCGGEGITRDDNPCMTCGGTGKRTPSALSGDDLAKGLRTSQKALDEIARQEQANIAGYLALRDFPIGSALSGDAGEVQDWQKPYADAGHDIASVFNPMTTKCKRCGTPQIDLSEDLAYGPMRQCRALPSHKGAGE